MPLFQAKTGSVPTVLMTDYVPGHIIGLLCPTALCGRDQLLQTVGHDNPAT